MHIKQLLEYGLVYVSPVEPVTYAVYTRCLVEPDVPAPPEELVVTSVLE